LKRNVRYVAFLAVAMPLTVAVLSALGEQRIDVYLSLFTLEYFVANALFSPRRRTRDYLGIILLVIFTYFVAMRVMEVLYGG